MEAEFSWWVSNRPMAWPCGKDLHFLGLLSSGKFKGHFKRVLGGCKGPWAAFVACSLSLSTSWTEPKAKPAPPGWHPRVSPVLQICIGASPTGYSYPPGQLWAPQNAFPSGWQEVQNRCGHSNKIHVLLNPVSRSNSAPPSKKPFLGSHSYSQTLGKGQEKRVFHSKPEWERSKESVQPVRFEWRVDNRQESKQGTLPPSLPPSVRVCAALQRCTQFMLYLKVPRFNWRGNVQQLSRPCCVTVGKCSLWNGSLWKQGMLGCMGRLSGTGLMIREGITEN